MSVKREVDVLFAKLVRKYLMDIVFSPQSCHTGETFGVGLHEYKQHKHLIYSHQQLKTVIIKHGRRFKNGGLTHFQVGEVANYFY